MDLQRHVDDGFQVQLEEDRGSSRKRSWMESSGLWWMLHSRV